MTATPRVLVAVEGDIAGHAVRTARLIRIMQAHGVSDVAVLSGGRLTPYLGARPIEGGPIPFMSRDWARQAQRRPGPASRAELEALLARELAFDREVVKAGDYDLCVVDGRVTTRVAAAEIGLLTVAVVSSVWTVDPENFPVRVQRALRLAGGAVRDVLRGLSDHPRGHAPDASEIGAIHTLIHSDLERPSAVQEPHGLCVGSLLPPSGRRRTLQRAHALPNLAVSMGSTGQVRVADCAAQVLTMPAQPEAAWVPTGLRPMLDGADVLACHAGMGTVTEAAALGLPLIVQPGNAEQHAIGYLCTHYGLGVVEYGEEITAATVESALALREQAAVLRLRMQRDHQHCSTQFVNRLREIA